MCVCVYIYIYIYIYTVKGFLSEHLNFTLSKIQLYNTGVSPIVTIKYIKSLRDSLLSWYQK